MPDVSFPVLAISEQVLFGDLSVLFDQSVKQLEQKGLPNTILLYDICETPAWKHAGIKPPTVSDRMLILGVEPRARDLIDRALHAVGKRMPPPPRQKTHARVPTKANTPLKSLFREMEEIPLPILRVSREDRPGITLFFLRTPEIIAAFKEELPRTSLAADKAP